MGVGCVDGGPARVGTGVGAAAPGGDDGVLGARVPSGVAAGPCADTTLEPLPLFALGALPLARAVPPDAAVLEQAARARMAISARVVKNSPAGVRRARSGRGNGRGMRMRNPSPSAFCRLPGRERRAQAIQAIQATDGGGSLARRVEILVAIWLRRATVGKELRAKGAALWLSTVNSAPWRATAPRALDSPSC